MKLIRPGVQVALAGLPHSALSVAVQGARLSEQTPVLRPSGSWVSWKRWACTFIAIFSTWVPVSGSSIACACRISLLKSRF